MGFEAGRWKMKVLRKHVRSFICQDSSKGLINILMNEKNKLRNGWIAMVCTSPFGKGTGTSAEGSQLGNFVRLIRP